MTPKSDEALTSGTLPAAELNPLLNPTLNKHLGRWAEVYFTSPPERRDEAVLNLVRELESSPTTAETAPRRSLTVKNKPKNSRANANALTCRECGFENEDQQRFCGECGAALAGPAGSWSATGLLTPLAERGRFKESEPDLSRDQRIEPMMPPFGSILHLTDPGSRRTSSAFTDDSEYAESTPLKRSYRLYIGAALALILAGLAYVAWRGGQSTAEAPILPAPAPPAASQATSSAATTGNSPAVSSSSPAASSPIAVERSTAAPAPAATTAAPNRERESAANPLPAPNPPANPGNPTDLAGGGSQELVLAQNLLNGVGTERDSAAAAQWLWKAVEKQNTAATVLLGGLYLRGDGVQKNCEQGRVLLDAAAVKGNKNAATLLRNLQAFGCK